ncbi:mitochondrial carrier [Epithele typhae]|uniref:mitochondrial carrier n=1 Tax=Epithele typhae TaxID=378194 RepID=UPI0020085656|nr:mitochondrial carrier [Epithele typhae]KAH9944436.1 mitochondrial carrier [Epithele typhae]
MDPFEAKLVAAAVGSTVTALTMTPFDVVKTRLQTQPPRPRPSAPLFPNPPQNQCCQPSGAPCIRNMSTLARSAVEGEVVCVWDHGVYRTERVNGFFDAVKHVWKVEGLAGLWKGAGTSLLIGVPASTCYMLTYDHLLNTTLPPLLPQAVVPLSAGIVARTAMTSLLSPLELVRTNLQSTPISPDNPHTLRSVLTSVRNLARVNGWHYLWRGVGPTLWRDVPFSGLYWAGYELCKRRLGRMGYEGAGVAFVSGAASGTTAALLTSPFDVLKTRRQALLMASSSTRTSSLGLAAEILRTEGPAALYAGIAPRITKIAPAAVS